MILSHVRTRLTSRNVNDPPCSRWRRFLIPLIIAVCLRTTLATGDDWLSRVSASDPGTSLATAYRFDLLPTAPGDALRDVSLALGHSNSRVRSYAAAALGEIETSPTEAVTTLIPLLDDDNPQVRAQATVALSKIGVSAVEDLIARLTRAESGMGQSSNGDERLELTSRGAQAGVALVLIGEPAVAALRAKVRADLEMYDASDRLTSRDRNVLHRILGVLRIIGSSNAVLAIGEAMVHPNQDIRYLADGVFSVSGRNENRASIYRRDPQTAPALRELISSPTTDHGTKLRALQTIGKLNDHGTANTHVLETVIRGKDNELAEAAAASLQPYDPATVTLVTRLLQEADPLIQARGKRLFLRGRFGTTDAAAALRDVALRHSDKEIRVAALKQQARTDQREAAGFLKRYERADDPAEETRSLIALHYLGFVVPPVSTGVTELLGAKDYGTRLEAAQFLSDGHSIDDDTLARSLAEILEHGTVAQRIAAARMLTRQGVARQAVFQTMGAIVRQGYKPSWIGIRFRPSGARGVVIISVDDDGPAAFAGLQQNDILVGWGDQEITRSEQLFDAITATPAGTRLTVTVRRDEREHSLDMVTSPPPAGRAFLPSKVQEWQSEALIVLADWGGHASDFIPDLVQLAQAGGYRGRPAAIDALVAMGRDGSSDAIEALKNLARTDIDGNHHRGDVFKAMIDAGLAKLWLVVTATAALADSDDAVRRRAASYLLTMKLSRENYDDIMVRFLMQNSSSRSEVRDALMVSFSIFPGGGYTLGSLAGSSGEKALRLATSMALDLAESVEVEDRRTAMRVFGRLPALPEQVLSKLPDLLDEPDLRRQALRILLYFTSDSNQIIPIIVRSISRDELYAPYTLQRLKALDPGLSEPPLKSLVENEVANLATDVDQLVEMGRSAADSPLNVVFERLGQLGSWAKSAEASLTRALQAELPDIRLRAVWVLLELGANPAELAGALYPFIDEPDETLTLWRQGRRYKANLNQVLVQLAQRDRHGDERLTAILTGIIVHDLVDHLLAEFTWVPWPSPPSCPTCMTAGPSGPDWTLPEFWPPPPFSAWDVLPAELFDEATADLGEVYRQLKAALEKNGFYENGLYSAPGGFALVTRVERMADNGQSSDPQGRWTNDRFPPGKISLATYLARLFTAPPGRFRMFALIVTTEPKLTRSGEELEITAARSFAHYGGRVLPEKLAAEPFAEHFVHAVVYHFEKRRGPVKFIEPSPWEVRKHLEGAGIWTSLASL